MKHGITEQEWEAYTEGCLDETASDRIEAHLIGCLACWEEYEGLKQAAEAWHAAGAAVRWQTPLSDAALHDGLQRVLTRARATDTVQDLTGKAAIQTRLTQLEAVLALLCGTRTAFCALRAAAPQGRSGSGQGSLPDLAALRPRNSGGHGGHREELQAAERAE